MYEITPLRYGGYKDQHGNSQKSTEFHYYIDATNFLFFMKID